MDGVLREIKKQFDTIGTFQKSDAVVIAVSGGVDSMVLLHAVHELTQLKMYQHKKIAVAHFNHNTRAENEQEATGVRQQSEQYGFTYFSEKWKQPASKNFEAEARRARYAFFAEVVLAFEAQLLLTAHHLDDLMETFFMRVTRGTSFRGLQGIRSHFTRLLETPCGKTVVTQVQRPMLQLEKADIIQYATKHQVTYFEDPTNAQLHYQRNRFRQTYLTPFIDENPNIRQHIASLTRQLQVSYALHFKHYLQIEPMLLMLKDAREWVLYRPEFLKLSPEELEIYVTLFFEERLIYFIPHYHREAIGQLMQLIRSDTQPNQTFALSDGWLVQRSYDFIKIYHHDHKAGQMKKPLHDSIASNSQLASERDAIQNDVEYTIRFNEWQTLPSGERVGIFEKERVDDETIAQSDSVLTMSLVTNTHNTTKQSVDRFVLRQRRKGDKVTIYHQDGTSHHKKVSRILIDAKIPQVQRDSAWFLVQNDQNIVWSSINVLTYLYKSPQTDKMTHIFLFRKATEVSK